MKDLKDLYQKARQFKRKGMLTDAVKLCDEIIAEDPQYDDINSFIGEIYYIKGDINKSIHHYEKQILKCKDNCMDYYRLAIAYYRSTQFNKTIQTLKDIINRGCQLDMAYYWMGLSYFHTGRIQKSIDTLEILRNKLPHNTVGCYSIAIAYRTIGNHEKAIECFTKILKEDPQIASVHYNLALTYLENMQADLAIKHLQKVIELDPKHKDAQNKLDDIFNDQEMLYSYGIKAPKDVSNLEELNINFYIGEAYKGFNMIDKTFKYLKEKALDKDKEEK